MRILKLASLLLVLGTCKVALAQTWLVPADTLNKARFIGGLSAGALAYGGALYGLDQIWYAQYPRAPFRTFNDWGEWLQMDKVGHAYTAYFFTDWAYSGARWAGVQQNSAVLTAGIAATVYQTTIELFDAHSAQWGWSWGDVAFNTAGTGLYLGQVMAFGEQKVWLKFSSNFQTYSQQSIVGSLGTPGSRELRARAIYGYGWAERLIKDYNAQSYWLSTSPALWGAIKWPSWLCVSLGYGVQDLYGARSNTWIQNGEVFRVNDVRSRQLFLSLDVDFTRIQVKNRYLKLLLKGLNVFKVPFPAFAITRGKGSLMWLP
jgi:hypothetical protein